MQQDGSREHGVAATADGPCLRPGAFLVDGLYQAVSLLRSYSGNAFAAGADAEAGALRMIAADVQDLARKRREQFGSRTEEH